MNRTPNSVVVLRIAGALLLLLAFVARPVAAQPYGEPRFDRSALDAMLAPIALYPDPLLSQILMAATYPREIAEAAHWLSERPGLSGDAAVRSAEGWDWDPSVRSLLAFPQVLQTLADYPRWTEDLGAAFLVQREDVMDAIQQLRRRALAAGTLRATQWTRIIDHGYAITIEPTTPQVVYVPYYDPRVTFGTWWWSSRPPMFWSRWPGYYASPGRSPYLYWGPGIHLGAGFFFGNFVWAQREVRVVDVRPYYYPRTVVIERQVIPGRPVIEHRAPVPGIWHYDAHRRYADDRHDVNRGERRPQEPPRPALVAPRTHDDRSLSTAREPRPDRREFDRRDRGSNAPPPARIAPMQREMAPTVVPETGPARRENREPRMDRGSRGHTDERAGPRSDTRGVERRGIDDDARSRRPRPGALAATESRTHSSQTGMSRARAGVGGAPPGGRVRRENTG